MNEKCPEKKQIDQTPNEPEMLILIVEESVWFVNLLMQPAWEPSEALLRAAERHRELFGDDHKGAVAAPYQPNVGTHDSRASDRRDISNERRACTTKSESDLH